MKGDKLNLLQMDSGDILIQQEMGGFTHGMIATGQFVVSHRSNAGSNVTHAGIYDGMGGILEASGKGGLQDAELVTKAKDSKYQVFRLKNNSLLADTAKDWAMKLLAHREESSGFGGYGKGKALKGMFTISARGSGAKKAVQKLIDDPYTDRAFYCSNFVVECYELAADTHKYGPLIDVDYRKVTPKVLQANLRSSSSWEYVGNYYVA